jgi:BCCT family betaine/carnitine transporter
VVGEKAAHGLFGKIVDIIFIFGILGGLSCTLAFGVPMLTDNLSKLTGLTDGIGLQVGMMLFTCLVFFISSWVGLEKGMKNLSDWNAYVAIALAIFVLVAGPTMFEIKAFTNGFGYMMQNFVHMSLWTDPIKNGGFPEGWTAFYWAWWLGLGPWMWIFCAKVSKGRTIREMLLGVVGAGSLGCCLYFGTVSNYGLYMQINKITDYVTILQQQGATAAITAMVHSLPLGTLCLAVWIIVGIMFLATTLDSASWTLAASVTKDLGEDEEPKRSLRMGWSLLLAVVPLSFIFAKADLGALQTLAILTAVPIAVLAIMSMIAAVKYVRDDFGDMTLEQIIGHNKRRDLEAANEAKAIAADKTVA